MTGFEGFLKKEKNDEKISEKIRYDRLQRYSLQSVAREALPKERVSICLRHRLGTYVSVLRSKNYNKAFYDGLMVCGSVWACPVCAAKISERRKTELKSAFMQHESNGGKIALLTLTFSHKKTDKLAVTLEKFSLATRKLFSGKAYSNIRKDMDIIGRVRVFEVTYGSNGFHPHLHIAIFYNNGLADLNVVKEKMFGLWTNACKKYGLVSTKKYGLDLQTGEHAHEYLAKHGTWSLEQELTKAHIKVAKNQSMTPFDFLREYLKTSDVRYLNLFREYYECFKGRRQLHWSQGLKEMFNLEDKTDEQVSKEKIDHADLLGMLEPEDWRKILRHDQRAQLLSNIESLGFLEGVAKIKRKISLLESLHND